MVTTAGFWDISIALVFGRYEDDDDDPKKRVTTMMPTSSKTDQNCTWGIYGMHHGDEHRLRIVRNVK